MPTTIHLSPQSISEPLKRGETIEKTLTIQNMSEETNNYQVDTEEAYRQWVDPIPDFFPLHAQQSRDVKLVLGPPAGLKWGTHAFKIVVFNDENAEDRAEVDVALEVRIPIVWWIIGGMVVLLILLLVLWQSGVFP